MRPPKRKGWFREDFTGIHGLTRFGCSETLQSFRPLRQNSLARLTRCDIVISARWRISTSGCCASHIGSFRFAHPGSVRLCLRASLPPGASGPDLPSHSLDSLAARIGHKFNHHHAQSDAEAAGRVLLAMMKYAVTQARLPLRLLRKAGVMPRRFCQERLNFAAVSKP